MRRPDPRKLVRDMNRAMPKKIGTPSFKHKNIPELVEIIPPRATTERFAIYFSKCKVTNYRLQAFTFGECSILLTREYGLLHMSISHPARYPTWDEIAAARYKLIPGDSDAIMVLPPEHEYINYHEFCFQVHQLAPGVIDRALNHPTEPASGETSHSPHGIDHGMSHLVDGEFRPVDTNAAPLPQTDSRPSDGADNPAGRDAAGRHDENDML